jgi:hypothetical protein
MFLSSISQLLSQPPPCQVKQTLHGDIADETHESLFSSGMTLRENLVHFSGAKIKVFTLSLDLFSSKLPFLPVASVEENTRNINGAIILLDFIDDESHTSVDYLVCAEGCAQHI